MDRFSAMERQRMLALKGVGPIVVERLEQIGFSSLAQVADASVDDLVRQIAGMLGTTCWRNSSQARSAMEAVVALVRQMPASDPDGRF